MGKKILVDKAEYVSLYENFQLLSARLNHFEEAHEKVSLLLNEGRQKLAHLTILYNGLEDFRVTIVEQLTSGFKVIPNTSNRWAGFNDLSGERKEQQKRDFGSRVTQEKDFEGTQEKIVDPSNDVDRVPNCPTCGQLIFDVQRARRNQFIDREIQDISNFPMSNPTENIPVEWHTCEHCGGVYRYYCDCRDRDDVSMPLDAVEEEKCIHCRKIGPIPGLLICSDCIPKYVDHGLVKSVLVCEKCGVNARAMGMRFCDSCTWESDQSSATIYKCAKCSTPIKSGVFCEDCFKSVGGKAHDFIGGEKFDGQEFTTGICVVCEKYPSVGWTAVCITCIAEVQAMGTTGESLICKTCGAEIPTREPDAYKHPIRNVAEDLDEIPRTK